MGPSTPSMTSSATANGSASGNVLSIAKHASEAAAICTFQTEQIANAVMQRPPAAINNAVVSVRGFPADRRAVVVAWTGDPNRVSEQVLRAQLENHVQAIASIST